MMYRNTKLLETILAIRTLGIESIKSDKTNVSLKLAWLLQDDH
jgi:hypothetical protein